MFLKLKFGWEGRKEKGKVFFFLLKKRDRGLNPQVPTPLGNVGFKALRFLQPFPPRGEYVKERRVFFEKNLEMGMQIRGMGKKGESVHIYLSVWN